MASKPSPPGLPRNLQSCGTPAAYKRHLKAGEQSCEDCRKAEADRSRASYVPKTGRRYAPRGTNGRLLVCGREGCEQEFWSVKRSRGGRTRYCSQACAVLARTVYDIPRAASKAATRARRLRHTETWDGVTDQQIFERDGWACKIPGCELGPLRRDLTWPDPLSPVIDHIIPLVRGGADTAPNKRAAHNLCNLRRGSRMHADDVQVVTPKLAPLGLLPTREAQPPRCCVVCQTALVSRDGATCLSCRQAAKGERRQRALALREQGMSWAKVAVELGLSSPGAAYNVAYPPDWSVYQKPGTAVLARRYWPASGR